MANRMKFTEEEIEYMINEATSMIERRMFREGNKADRAFNYSNTLRGKINKYSDIYRDGLDTLYNSTFGAFLGQKGNNRYGGGEVGNLERRGDGANYSFRDAKRCSEWIVQNYTNGKTDWQSLQNAFDAVIKDAKDQSGQNPLSKLAQSQDKDEQAFSKEVYNYAVYRKKEMKTRY